jgi:hypothetical protein
MSKLSPEDASMLALIAENRKSPALVKKLLVHTSPEARKIARIIVAPRSGRTSESVRRTANAIRHWAATNRP